MWVLLTNCAATQWLLGLATWQQCKKHNIGGGGKKGRGSARVWGSDFMFHVSSFLPFSLC